MTSQTHFVIRPLEAADVPALLETIAGCRREYGLEGQVPSLLEPSDHGMFDLYRQQRSAYFVAVIEGAVAGGAGIAPLAQGSDHTCELQRMYLRPSSRSLGIGQALLTACIEAARRFQFGYCYAETISGMTTAIAFYQRNGFRSLSTPIGRTGHGHNDCWLLLDMRAAID